MCRKAPVTLADMADVLFLKKYTTKNIPIKATIAEGKLKDSLNIKLPENMGAIKLFTTSTANAIFISERYSATITGKFDNPNLTVGTGSGIRLSKTDNTMLAALKIPISTPLLIFIVIA